MGMYDEVLIKIKCPKCSKTREWRVQTKELECVLAEYNVGDSVNTKHTNILGINNLFGIGNCPNCNTQKYMTIFLKDKIITDKYELMNSIYR